MTTRKIALVTSLVAAMTIGAAGTASAHNVNVGPSGVCQFLGGPGNPNHAGHSHGHVVALAAEASDAISIGGC